MTNSKINVTIQTMDNGYLVNWWENSSSDNNAPLSQELVFITAEDAVREVAKHFGIHLLFI